MKYKAFISYKHSNTSAFAEVFELHLKVFAKGFFEKPDKLFRDEQYLQPGDNLPQAIKQALLDSEYLILLASPEAATSVWVKDELETWCKEFDRSEKLIVVLTSGSIMVNSENKIIDWNLTNSLPSLLRDYLPSLPLFVDLSWIKSKEEANLSNNAYRTAINAIAARIRNTYPNILSGKEWKIRRKNIIAAWSISFILLLLLIVLAIGLFIIDQKNKDLKQALVVSRSRELTSISQLQTIPEELITAADAVSTSRNKESIFQLLTALSDNPTLNKHILKLTSAVRSLVFDNANNKWYTVSKNEVIGWNPNFRKISKLDFKTENELNGICILPNGQIIGISDASVWNISTGTQMSFFDINISAIALNPGGAELLVGLADGSVMNMSLKTGKVKLLYRHKGLVTDIGIVGNVIISSALDKETAILVYHVDREITTSMLNPPFSANALDISPDGKKIGIAFEDGTIGLYKFPDLEKIWTQSLNKNANDIKFNHAGNWLTAGTSGGQIVIFDTGGFSVDSWIAARSRVTKLMWQQDTLISGSDDGWIRSWLPGQIWPSSKKYKNVDFITWHGNSLVGIDTNTIWDMSSDAKIATISNKLSNKILAAKNNIVALKTNASQSVYYLNEAKFISFPAEVANLKVVTAAISDDENLVASCWWPLPPNSEGCIGKISIWNIKTGKVVWIDTVSGFPKPLTFCGTDLLASSGRDGIFIWNLKNYRLVARNKEQGLSPISDIIFMSQEKIVVGDEKGVIKIVNTYDPDKTIASTAIPKEFINSLQLLANNSIVSLDPGGVRWFDSTLNYNGLLLKSGNERPLVNQIRISPKNNQLAIRLQSGMITIIPFDIDKWISYAREKGSVLIR